MTKTCANCKYADYSDCGYSVCTNHDSPHKTDYVSYDNHCEKFESKKTNNQRGIFDMTNTLTLRQVLPICMQTEEKQVLIMLDTPMDTVPIHVRKGEAELVLSDKVLDSRVGFIEAIENQIKIIVKMDMPNTPVGMESESFF